MSEPKRSGLGRELFPLRGRVAVVTGVSRRGGIGYAIACRLAAYGASVFLHHFAPHDRDQAWGTDDLDAVVQGVRWHLGTEGASVADLHADLAAPGAPEQVIEEAVAEFGHLDILVCNHALTGDDGPLGELTAARLDRHWAVNGISDKGDVVAGRTDVPVRAIRPTRRSGAAHWMACYRRGTMDHRASDRHRRWVRALASPRSVRRSS